MSELTNTIKIEGIPAGWQIVRIGQPERGESVIDYDEVVRTYMCSNYFKNYVIVKRIEPPIEPSPGYRLLEIDESVDRSSDSKYQYRTKEGGLWGPVGGLCLSSNQRTDCYYQCPIEPPKTIDVGEGWRLLRDDEPKAEGDQCRLKSKDSWIPVRLDCPKHSPEVMFYRRRIEPPQPTYIPWTDDTCPVGSVVKFAGKNPQVIQEAIAAGCFLGRGGYWSYHELVRNENITHNGKPCGTPGVKTCDH